MHKNLLTILIPTYERNYFLSRKLHNFSLQACLHKILVLDSSGQPIAQQNRDLIERTHQHLDIEYHHIGTETHFAKKLGIGIDGVKTPYAIFSFDDDFLNLSTVEKAISSLEADADAVSASGLVANFIRPRDKSFRAQRVPVIGKYMVFNEPDPLVRIETFLTEKRARNPLFNVWRSPILKHILGPVSNTPWRKFGEILFDHAAVYAGRALLLETLLEIRHVDYRKEEYRKAGLPQFRGGLASEFSDSTFSPVFSKMVNVCAKMLEDLGHGDKQVLKNFVAENYLRYRTRRHPLSYGTSRFCDKLETVFSGHFFARARRLGSLIAACHSRGRMRLINDLIKLHGRTTTIDMIQNDPKLRINYFTLTSGTAPDYLFVSSVYKTLSSHPEPHPF